MYQRSLKPSKTNSFFLFGARATGKTTLLQEQEFLANALQFDLLDPELEARFALNPRLLLEQASKLSPGSWIVIDEVQKVPKLLSLVHKIIEEKKVHFALTGSSARKLRRGGADMLAGRAFVFYLFPLTYGESLQKGFELRHALSWGSLPKVVGYSEDLDRIRYLNAYVHTYIKEEIQVEQLVRNLDPFRLFLKVAAQNNGKIINYSNIAKDTGVDIKSVQNYYEILRDTHLGFLLEPFGKSIRKVSQTHCAPHSTMAPMNMAANLNHGLSMSAIGSLTTKKVASSFLFYAPKMTRK
jgi:predicted AAA+ superfamily ATPase